MGVIPCYQASESKMFIKWMNDMKNIYIYIHFRNSCFLDLWEDTVTSFLAKISGTDVDGNPWEELVQIFGNFSFKSMCTDH